MTILYENTIISRKFFIYNAISHLILALIYAYSVRDNLLRIFTESIGWDAEFGRMAFIVGHFLISSAQFVLSNQDADDVLKVTWLGMMGHCMLLIYVSWIATYYKWSFKLIVFMLGQFGMVYFYMNHTEGQTIVYKKKDTEIKKKDIFRCIFAVLCFYYVIGAIQSSEHTRYGMGMVAGVYAGLLYNFSK